MAKFGVLSLGCVGLWGLAVGHVLKGQIHDRVLQNASDRATFVGLHVHHKVPLGSFTDGLSRVERRQLDSTLRLPEFGDVQGLRIVNRDRRVIYSDSEAFVDNRLPASGRLRSALAGELALDLDYRDRNRGRAGTRGEVYEAYVPIHGEPGQPPKGAFEVYLPYGPVVGQIKHDSRQLYLVLFGGLALLYAALLPIVARASRRLRSQAARNEHQALHDSLTDMPNRRQLFNHLRDAIERDSRGDDLVAVMVVDLDHFKEVNDALGHHVGDRLLRLVGSRLSDGLRRRSDLVARLGGDEFALVLPDLESTGVALDLAERIRKALELPFAIDGHVIQVDASIGIALYPDHGSDVDTLVSRADLAMYAAKGTRSGYRVYSAAELASELSPVTVAGELRQALSRDQLVLHYQPQAKLTSGEIVAVEALIRWQHPERGLLPPKGFLSIAEQTRLLRPVTRWVLDTALRQHAIWLESGLDLQLAVNLSAQDLLDRELSGEIRELLDRHGVPGSRLKIEVTESMVMADPARTTESLGSLTALGAEISLDDFGTGYSSLSRLKHLPLDEIKIDRIFVSDMAKEHTAAVIVESTAALGRSLGLRVVAEGVETEEAWDELAELGCDLAQGYHLSQPLPAEAVADWVRAASAERAA